MSMRLVPRGAGDRFCAAFLVIVVVGAPMTRDLWIGIGIVATAATIGLGLWWLAGGGLS